MSFPSLESAWERNTFPYLRQYREHSGPPVRFQGLAGAADAFLAADLLSSSDAPVVVAVENAKRAEAFAEDCRSYLGWESVCLLPSRDPVPYNMKSPFGPTIESRLRALARMMDGERAVYVVPAPALLQKVPPRKELFNRIIRLETGDEVEREQLNVWLLENGFHKETLVSDLGTFSVRGDIIDIYPFMTENPIRVELWGNTIESIREFDVFSQKSKQRRGEVEIFPMREFCFSDEDVDEAVRRMRDQALKGEGDPASVELLEHQWNMLGDHEGTEWYLHWFPAPTVSLFDFIPPGATFVWNDLLGPDPRLTVCRENYQRHLSRVPGRFLPFVSPPDKLLVDQEHIERELQSSRLVYVDTGSVASETREIRCGFGQQPSLPRNIDSIAKELQGRHEQGVRTVIVSPNVGAAERLWELLGERCPFLEIDIGLLHDGFIDNVNGRAIYSEARLFHHRPRPTRHHRIKGGTPLPAYDALSPGDYVVHVDHGIGRFAGIRRIEAGGVQRDCMALSFKERAQLFVPIDDFHKVQKYVGGEGASPALSRLGSGAWERLKSRTRRSLKEMAQELIQLYADRRFREGIAFPADSMWQREFEDSFSYEETPDQAAAIKQVKKDMEASKPMDRLICGDVGFGKTEVAMRAAFKAATNGHQVAVLAPTTILAYQHYVTFTERMASFPLKIDLISRFRTAREQKGVVAGIAAGKVDVVIGTHRLLSRDIRFKNLGLLVVDEEQKFGVRHKEKLKQLRTSIDVLSMTATPIPRTLHMSLIGARDFSIMNTPPQNRLPVETRVSEYNHELVRNAVENELERGGQVFVVHNRVRNLEGFVQQIEQLVPRARIAWAHGRMEERQLESIMKQFLAGRFDVLVSTVIIENGLDIANVNTLIVNNAHAMGLAQLYQLRGRVGRSSEQAYAYLLTPPVERIEEKSLRRLRALEQYTELGSGFQIAMRDLEIRGAGTILGTRQHGFIAAVGFDMYCRLLAEAVGEARGEPVDATGDTTRLEVDIEAYIPPEYVSDGSARVALYQKLSSAGSVSEVEEIGEEIVDRFGPAPAVVQRLLGLMKLKVMGRILHAESVRIDAQRCLMLTFEGDDAEVRERMAALISSASASFEIVNSTPPAARTTLSRTKSAALIAEAIEVLRPACETVRAD